MESPEARWKALRPGGKPSGQVASGKTVSPCNCAYFKDTSIPSMKRRGASFKQNWAEDLRHFKPLLSDKPNGICLDLLCTYQCASLLLSHVSLPASCPLTRNSIHKFTPHSIQSLHVSPLPASLLLPMCHP